MNTVKSKYKNPDRYIAELKRSHSSQIDAMKKDREYWYKRFGVAFLSYSPDVTYGFSVTCSSLSKVAVNSKIVIEATVKNVKGDRDSSSIEFDNIMIRESKK